MNKQDLTIRKNEYGAWVVSAVVNGYYEHRQYYYYTKKQAINQFLSEFSGD